MRTGVVEVMSAISDVFEVEIGDLSGPSRDRNIVTARHLFCYLMRKYTGHRLKRIGLFIDRDHSTVIYGSKRMVELIELYPEIKAKVERVEKELKS